MRSRSSAALFLSAAALAVGGYALGAWSFAHESWPIPELRDAKRVELGQSPLPSRFDGHGRLVSSLGKTPIACPAQDARTAVILFIGQSIQSNTAGQRFVSAHGDRVAAWFDGKCEIAASPLLGASEAMGEALTPTGNRLVARGAFDRVVLVPSAIGGTSIARWGAGGDLNRMLAGVLASVGRTYRITHVVWHQGEDDFSAGLSGADYTRHFHEMLATIRAGGVEAPVFVSVATRCDDDFRWRPDNPIARAQRALVDPRLNVLAGVDTDALLDPVDRYDGCHLGASGVARYADALADLLSR